MWFQVVQHMKELAARVPRPKTSEFNHFAAIVNRRGQILATGFNSGHEHAEMAVIRRFALRTRQPFTQVHKPALSRQAARRPVPVTPAPRAPRKDLKGVVKAGQKGARHQAAP